MRILTAVPQEMISQSREEVENKSITSVKGNPFPGLRPFGKNESHLFFGREESALEILSKIAKNRVVTIMGASGSGKSSLISCGVIPILYGGFMTEAGSDWCIINTRPANSPISNLSNSIVDYLEASGRLKSEDKKLQNAIINSTLRSGDDGLIKVAEMLIESSGSNVFFSIDQFEELIRYRQRDKEANNESIEYVNLILNAVNKKKVPIYLALGMRSDHVGECSQFYGLTQMVNSSSYLIPQMTRQQLRLTIECPIAIANGEITQRLVYRLLSDISENQFQLPILQHSLMRTWDYWVANREPDEPIDIRHYNAIGRIEQALSLHANEAYDELNNKEKNIAEKLFKLITEKNQDNSGHWRPSTVKEISNIIACSTEEVIMVANVFRQVGRSFLMPDASVSLTESSVIEISHESFMRIWSRLSQWVEEEFESAQLYKRISNAALLYQNGKAGLWRPPDLQYALIWLDKQKPTLEWAKRYDVAFERVIVFLETSRITYEAELRNQELLQLKTAERNRMFLIVITSVAVVAILFMIYGFMQSIEANKQRQLAESDKKVAEVAKNEAVKQALIAKNQTLLSQQSQRKLEATLNELSVAFRNLEIANVEKEKSIKLALEKERLALEAQKNENSQRIIAETQTEIATKEFERANSLLMLTIAQSLEAKSVTMDDSEMAGLLAMQGYLFHTSYGGKKYDPYVFKGLYYAIGKLKHDYTYNVAKVSGNMRNKMYGLAVSRDNSTFFTTGNDGRIFAGDFRKLTVDRMVDYNPYPNRVLALSPDGKYLVVGSDSSFMKVIRVDNLDEKPRFIEGHYEMVSDIKFLPDGSGFVSTSSDGDVRLTNPLTDESRILITLSSEAKSMDVSADGKFIAIVSVNGQANIYSFENHTLNKILDDSANNIKFLSVAFHPTQPILAIGTEFLNNENRWKGTVKIINFHTKEFLRELGGHDAGVSDVEFSPDGLLLASSGYDKKLQMWVVDHVEDLPVVMDLNSSNIWKLGFSKDSDYLLASCNNGEIRVWQTNLEMLANQICSKLSRNITKEEWNIYVGNQIPPMQTCPNIQNK